MMYQGSAAYQLDSREVAPVRRPLTVVDGGRRVQRAPQPVAFPLPVIIVTLSIVVALVGAVRIALTAATVDSLRQIERAEATVAETRDTMTELMVERSTLSSTDRIQRIATENYGMVYASEVDTVTVDISPADEAVSEDAVQGGSAAAEATPQA